MRKVNIIYPYILENLKANKLHTSSRNIQLLFDINSFFEQFVFLQHSEQ